MLLFTARYNDGLRAVTRDVRLAIDGQGITVLSEAGTQIDRWQAPQVRLIDRSIGPAPVWRLGMEEDAARLLLTDPGAMAAVEAACPSLGGGSSRGGRRRLVLLIGAAALSVVLMLTVGVPLLAGAVARTLPPEWEEGLGQGLAAAMEAHLAAGRCLEPAGILALDRLVARLDMGGAVREVRVVGATFVNAFALPGGIVILTGGLIAEAGSPEALAGVIAHEIGHIEQRDALAGLLRAVGTSLILALVVGDVTGGTALQLMTEDVLAAGHSRDAERTADARAAAILAEAGIDTGPFARFLERLDDGGPAALAFLATHPPGGDRAAAIARGGGRGGSAATPEDWGAIARMCRSN